MKGNITKGDDMVTLYKLHWPYLTMAQGKVTESRFTMCGVYSKVMQCTTVKDNVSCSKCLAKIKGKEVTR